jgi:protein MpaA
MKKVREYSHVVEEIETLSKDVPGLMVRKLGVVRAKDARYDFFAMSLGDGEKEIALSGGIHGDEPAGVEAVLGFLRRIRYDPSILSSFRFTILPCLNPFGYEHDTRQNGSKLDLNRQFGKARPPVEVRMARGALEGKKFEFAMEFHEDVDTDGYYLYEVCADPGRLVGEEIIQKISKRWPINLRAEIEGAPSRNGVINPHLAGDFFQKRVAKKQLWPQAIWLYQNGTGHCITSETPVTHPMPERVDIHLTALQVALTRLK